MELREVEFELLDFVQTTDGKTFSIGFKDNENKKTISKCTAHRMYKRGQITKKSKEVDGETIFESTNP